MKSAPANNTVTMEKLDEGQDVYNSTNDGDYNELIYEERGSAGSWRRYVSRVFYFFHLK